MLKVLPDQIANLIAAGEVIQRPASVVKELIENSVDANATSITVLINDYGRTLIQIIDDGSGMTNQEAALCFERHATSKISKAEDLYNITTYGFRGEALASIAACSDVILKTKRIEDEVGTEVHIAEGKIIDTSETSTAVGTNIAVRNIFYNIPARRKFLKSDNTELRQIISEFTKVALTRNDIKFRLTHNSKDIMSLTPTENIKQRIVQIEGKNAAKDLIDIHTETSIATVDGYVGNPQLAKKNQGNQYFFVNNRYFRSPQFNKAILKAYETIIPSGTYPSYYIFLTIDPSNTDVNIHPTKTEIKFENESAIFQILNASVKEAIGLGSFSQSIDFDVDGTPDFPTVNADFNNREKYLKSPKINFNPLFNPFDKEKEIFEKLSEEFEPQTQESLFATPLRSNLSEMTINENEGELSCLTLRGRYIITPVKSGIMLIDAIKAKRRILYEHYSAAISCNNIPIQENMFPEAIDIDAESFSLLMNYAQQLKNIGFDIREFGEKCIVVYGIPTILSDEKISARECINNLITDLREMEIENGENRVGNALSAQIKDKMALDMVKSDSISHNFSVSNIEARLLIDELFECKSPNLAIEGGLCAAIIPVGELVKFLN